MKAIDPRMLLAGGLLSLAFAGGIVAAPNLITPAAAQVLGTGSGNVVSNSGPNRGGNGVLATAAQYIGITEQQLRDQLAAGKSLADVAIANGKTRDGLIQALTQAEGQRIAQIVDQKGFGAGKGGGPGFGRGGHGMPGMANNDDLSAAASYLGISETDLRAKIQSGSTLASIANATSGKSRDGLVQALVAHETTEIDQAVTAGKLTADQATQMKSQLTQRYTNVVDNVHPTPTRGMR